MGSKKLISVVVPSYNEEFNVPLVAKELKKIFYSYESVYDHEIIFVNDGSKDNTWKSIIQLTKQDNKIKGINLSRNFGHASALQAGLEHSRGEAVISIDADLQHPPSLIPTFIKHWENGADIVSTIRQTTEGETVFKKTTSDLFYKLLTSLSSLKINPGEADFRLLSRKAVNTINSLPEKPKFYRGIVNWIGFNKVNVPYSAPGRIHGSSSYTIKKMLELARIGITSFSMRPLKVILAIGSIITFFSGSFFLTLLYYKLFINYKYVSNSVLLALVILFCTGVMITFQGVIAIYLIDIFNMTRNRPSYIIQDAVGIKI